MKGDERGEAIRLVQVKLNARITRAPDSIEYTYIRLRDGVKFVLLMDLFAVPASTVNIYLSERTLRQASANAEKKPGEKGAERRRHRGMHLNKWPVFIW